MTNTPNTRPAQVLLTERDRSAATDVCRRAADIGVRLRGPTDLYRVGLAALSEASDDAFRAAVRSGTRQLTNEDIEALYLEWCEELASLVSGAHQDLTTAYQGNGTAQKAGIFRLYRRAAYALRTVDGRVLLNGTEIRMSEDDTEILPMFHDGVARVVSVDHVGASLAAGVFTAWLLCDADRMEKALVRLDRDLTRRPL